MQRDNRIVDQHKCSICGGVMMESTKRGPVGTDRKPGPRLPVYFCPECGAVEDRDDGDEGDLSGR